MIIFGIIGCFTSKLTCETLELDKKYILLLIVFLVVPPKLEQFSVNSLSCISRRDEAKTNTNLNDDSFGKTHPFLASSKFGAGPQAYQKDSEA